MRQRHPSAILTVVVGARNAPLLEHHPASDDRVLLPIGRDRRPDGALPATLRLLRRRRSDRVVHFGAPVMGWLGAAYRIPRQEYIDVAPAWWLLPSDRRAWNRHPAVHR